MIPFRTPFFLSWLYPQLLWRMPDQEKKVYLTFDDGPVPGPTEFVLETLKQFNASATFFCIGDNVRKHTDVFSKVIAEGHSIGNHTFNHLKGWRTPLQAYLDNINQCETEFRASLIPDSRITVNRQLSTDDSQLFRPPYGQITRNQISALKGTYKIIMWDVLSQDYRESMTPDKCIRGTIAATRNGSIVIFHDSYKAERNLMFTLPRYLEYLSDSGYSFGRL
jgi:peptidoglycan-N-acetylglucosamine deacetylase